MTTAKRQTIADTARRLFREHGFSAVSVGGICAEAAVSRVTFYKYYSGKNALLQEIVAEQKNRVRTEFENLLARQCSLREAAEAVFALQKQSFEELYSAAFLRDIEENTNLELERFFHELNEEKYAFTPPDSARFAGGTHRPVHPSGGRVDAPPATGRPLCRCAAKAAAGRIGIAAARLGGRGRKITQGRLKPCFGFSDGLL